MLVQSLYVDDTFLDRGTPAAGNYQPRAYPFDDTCMRYLIIGRTSVESDLLWSMTEGGALLSYSSDLFSRHGRSLVQSRPPFGPTFLL